MGERRSANAKVPARLRPYGARRAIPEKAGAVLLAGPSAQADHAAIERDRATQMRRCRAVRETPFPRGTRVPPSARSARGTRLKRSRESTWEARPEAFRPDARDMASGAAMAAEVARLAALGDNRGCRRGLDPAKPSGSARSAWEVGARAARGTPGVSHRRARSERPKEYPNKAARNPHRTQIKRELLAFHACRIVKR